MNIDSFIHEKNRTATSIDEIKKMNISHEKLGVL